MIFLLFLFIAASCESRTAKNICMLICVGVIIFILVRIFKRFRKTNNIGIKILLSILSVCLLLDAFASLLKIEWKVQTVTPELIGSYSEGTEVLDPLFVRGVGAFTLTDSPPFGTCTSGDLSKSKFEERVQGTVFATIPFDFERYTYVFVRGSDQIQISYSFWNEYSSWYLGLKGFYRSTFSASLTSVREGSASTVYAFRFPKQYIAFSDYPAGGVTYGPFQSFW